MLLAFTFVSRSIYTAKLPEVTTIKTMSGNLPQNVTVKGELFYDKSDVCVKYTVPFTDAVKLFELSGIKVVYNAIAYEERGSETKKKLVIDTASATNISETIAENGIEYVAKFNTDGKDALVNTSAEVTLSSYSEPFQYIIPLACIKTDANGSYIFRLMERDSLFGRAYYVEKVDVSVLVKNNSQAAVDSQTLLNSSDIIMTTTLPIYDNSHVVVN